MSYILGNKGEFSDMISDIKNKYENSKNNNMIDSFESFVI